MSPVQLFRRRPFWALCLAIVSGLILDSLAPRSVDAGHSILGTQPWGPWNPNSKQPAPRVSVLETDAWEHSLKDGSLRPVAQYPFPRRIPRTSNLLRNAQFTPKVYLEQIEMLRRGGWQQKDILMYYGGIRYRPAPEGLNFNAWSGSDLKKLRAIDARPYIGLETMDRAAVRSMVWRLKEAGYGPLHRIYVRIGAEPSFSAYGTEDGTRTGKRRTPAAYAAYRNRFAQTAAYLNAMNRALGLNIHTVFAGASREDFSRYAPPARLFDAIGYDLYVTPENKKEVLRQIGELAKRYPHKPLVIPELGIATERHSRRGFQTQRRWSNPAWAADTLGDLLMALGRHPGGIAGITVFSVNVSGRRIDRRWSWAWTPRMYEMLKEWQGSPRRWRKDGFHRYDPLSYPVGQNVLFLNRPDLKIVYRRLPTEKTAGPALFQETSLSLRREKWVPHSQTVYFEGTTKKTIR